MLLCDLCREEGMEFDLHKLAPDILLCPRCSKLSAAEVTRFFVSKTWFKCPICGEHRRLGKCYTCSPTKKES